MLRQPPVRIFVMGTNRWRYEEDFPLERAEIVPHYLHQGGRLDRTPPGEEPPDRYAYDPAHPVPTCGGALLMTPDFPAGPRNQQGIEARPDVLTFSSEPLGEDVEVTGPIVVRLWAVSSATDTDFVARLCDVFPDGRSFNLTDGILRARYRSWRHGEPVSLIEPGRPYEYEIDLWATSNVFRAGHRIRLQVTSSSFPRWDRNPNTGHEFGVDTELVVARQEVLHDREHPSCVLLPVMPMETRKIEQKVSG
jgi:putative CocE/NonD family hydrolase